MEHRYSFEEYTDMHLMYGRAGGNRALARRLYQETFPNRHLPNEKTFQRVDERLREIRKFEQLSVNRGRRRVSRTVNKEEQILQHIADNPGSSTRRTAAVVATSHVTVWRVLREQLLYPYHLQRVQALTPSDYPTRSLFC
jgi:hypothetical protein